VAAPLDSVILDPLDSLILDLLEWLEQGPRPYAEVLEAWRTSCPRLPVWEEATDGGFIVRGRLVSLTPAGAKHLRERRPRASPAGTQRAARARVR